MNNRQSLGGGGARGYESLLRKIKNQIRSAEQVEVKLSKRKVSMKKAFTLAEVLITLGIIGIVAAMTTPALIGKYQKQAMLTKLQKAYSILNTAMRLAEAEHGDYEYWDSGFERANEYYEKYYKPYFKVVKECNTYQACGYSSNTPYVHLNGTVWNQGLIWEGRRKAFIATDGMIINLITGGGGGGGAAGEYGARDEFTVDINGPNKPNMLGKDVFRFVKRGKMALMPLGYDKTDDDISIQCSSVSSGAYCAAKIMRDSWKIKNDYPW